MHGARRWQWHGVRLKIDAFKVAHHASQNNLSMELLQLLECPRYIISTNGDHFSHPDRQAIGRIIKYGGDRPALYFNYNEPLQRRLGARRP
jgi:beta-lactamase superfamily II metal-dependent hydrolase